MKLHMFDIKGFVDLLFSRQISLASRLSRGKTYHIFGDCLLLPYGFTHIFYQWGIYRLKQTYLRPSWAIQTFTFMPCCFLAA